MKITHRHKIASYLIALIVMGDQLSKWWVLNASEARAGHIQPLTSFFNLVLVHNRGVTFGIFSRADNPLVAYGFVAVAVIILMLLGRWMLRTSSTLVTFALALIMGGAIGNIIDRLRYGAVIDFLDFYYRDHHWPAFNLADSCIVTGVALLLLDSLVRAR